MLSFPNCKINLGLRILRRRDDGYHQLETVFYPLPVRDALETIRSEELTLTATGLGIPGDPSQSLPQGLASAKKRFLGAATRSDPFA